MKKKKIDLSTKDVILNAAEKLISKGGTNSLCLRDIAKEADISLGTLYYYYKSRHDLIMDLASLYLKTLNEEYVSWLNRHKKDLTPDRFLEVIFFKGVKLFERGKIHLFLLNECINGDKKLQSEYSKLYKTWNNNFKIGIKQVFPKVKDKDSLSNLLITVVDGMIFKEVLNLDTKVDEDEIKSLIKRLGKNG